MAEEFDFEKTVGTLAQAVANKHWQAVREPLKQLAAHPAHEDAIAILVGTLEFMAERTGWSNTLDAIDTLLLELKDPRSVESAYAQGKLIEKWTEGCDALTKEDSESALSYLTSLARALPADHPVAALVMPRWHKVLEQRWPLQGFELDCTLSLDSDTKNPEFRQAVLAKLAEMKDAQPDEVLEKLTDIIDRGPFYSFKDKDAKSMQILFSTLADILDANKDRYDAKKVTDLAWKILSSGQGSDAGAEKTGARIYFDMAGRETDLKKAYHAYNSLLRRKSPVIAEESRASAEKILEMVEARKLKGRDHEDAVECVFENIFGKAIAEETRDTALAERAAFSLLNAVREEFAKPATRSYGHFNIALALYKYYPAGDEREAEVQQRWEAALAKNFKTDDDYYARQMGWMADAAFEKGDKDLAARTLKEWRNSIDTKAAKRVGAIEAHRTVTQIVVNAAHYKPDSPLVAEARSMVAELEQKAGIIRMPERMPGDDFLQMIGKRRQAGFRP